MLVCGQAGFLRGLPGGDPLTNGRRVALDFAVINALGQGHLAETRQGPLKAAIAYSDRKAMFQNTRAQCAQEGVVFEPIVFEAQGGIEPRAAAILHRIAECVATAEGGCMRRVKAQMFQRLSVIIARSGAAAIRRRAAAPTQHHYGAARSAVIAASTLEEADASL